LFFIDKNKKMRFVVLNPAVSALHLIEDCIHHLDYLRSNCSSKVRFR